MHLQLFTRSSHNIKFPISQFWFFCYGYWNVYASFKRGIEDKTVTTNVVSALPALLNAKIVWINIPKNCIKKKEVTK